MITARLLLMPVLRSVELNVVACAKAGRVLRARMAATMRSDGSRERIFGVDVFDDLHTRCVYFFVSGSDSFAALRAHSDRTRKTCRCMCVHKMQGQSVLEIQG